VVKILSHFPEHDPDIETIKLSVHVVHIHLIIVVPTRSAVAEAVQFIKSQSAKKINAKFPFQHKACVSKEGIW